MPAGRVHEAFNLALLGGGALAYLAWQGPKALEAFQNPQVLALGLGYLLGTFLLSPDLDLAEKGVRSLGYWGPLGWLWRPYGWLFRHRGLSHTWVLGPLTRIGYLGLLLWLLGLLLGELGRALGLQAPRVHLALSGETAWPGVLGYYLSQWAHLVLDGILPDHDLKRLRRPK